MAQAINYRELKRRLELDGGARTSRHLAEALESGALRPVDFSLRELAESLIPEGRSWVRTLEPRGESQSELWESGDGVDLTAFSQVTGSVVRRAILDAYEQEMFVASRLVRTIPTRLDGERIAGATRIAAAELEVGPGMPYPRLGFAEDFVETPRTTKRGLIVPVTREAVFFDRTHVVLQRAEEVGSVLGVNKERRLLDAMMGLSESYRWNGETYPTYATSGGWVNSLSGNALADWTSVDKAEQLLGEMRDAVSGDPILVQPNAVLVMPAARHAAQRVFQAAQIGFENGAHSTLAPNPLARYAVVESRLAYQQVVASGVSAAAAKQWWFLGNFGKAFAYMENWPITVSQSSANSEADFNNDILVQYKASERGAITVLNPRYVVKCTG